MIELEIYSLAITFVSSDRKFLS